MVTRSREDIMEEVRALMEKVDATLSAPRPPEELRWKGLEPTNPPAASGGLPEAQVQSILDTMAMGVAMAIKGASEPLLGRIRELETRLDALESRDE